MKFFEDIDPEHYGLLREVLQVIFGLEPNTINKVVGRIRSSTSAANVKTNMTRVRIGARAMKYLRNSIEIARHEGSEKHETGKEMDLQKDSDLEPTLHDKELERKAREAGDDAIARESVSFSKFLIAERQMTVSIDPEDPTETKKTINMAKRSPERSERQGMIKAKQDKQTAQREGDALATRIASLRLQLKQLEARQARLQGQGEKQ